MRRRGLLLLWAALAVGAQVLPGLLGGGAARMVVSTIWTSNAARISGPSTAPVAASTPPAWA